MFSWLLDRGSLQEEIDRLEDELAACEEAVERLESRLEATDERRREAVRTRQAVQEERNRLQDRIEQLEADLDRAGSDHEVRFRGETTLGSDAMRRVLEILRSVEAGPEGAYTAMVEGGRPAAIVEQLGDRVGLVDRAAPCLVLFDERGLLEVALDPPLPPEPFDAWDAHFDLDPAWFVPEEPFSFAVVRSDLAALGRFEGDGLSYVDGFESDVHGRHSKGGFSQSRFERRREEQVDAHLERTDDLLEDVTEPLIVTGSQAALEGLAVEADARATVDASGGPREALETAHRSFWRTRLYRL